MRLSVSNAYSDFEAAVTASDICETRSAISLSEEYTLLFLSSVAHVVKSSGCSALTSCDGAIEVTAVVLQTVKVIMKNPAVTAMSTARSKANVRRERRALNGANI